MYLDYGIWEASYHMGELFISNVDRLALVHRAEHFPMALLYTTFESLFANSHLSTSLLDIRMRLWVAHLCCGVRTICLLSLESISPLPLSTASKSANVKSSLILRISLKHFKCLHKIGAVVSDGGSHFLTQAIWWRYLLPFTGNRVICVSSPDSSACNHSFPTLQSRGMD